MCRQKSPLNPPHALDLFPESVSPNFFYFFYFLGAADRRFEKFSFLFSSGTIISELKCAACRLGAWVARVQFQPYRGGKRGHLGNQEV